ncbi:MAG TPA: tetratricopeptide repeat protein [Candidatus Binatia bacterium]|jgi:hypothetical protein|nr:tetratricopeptide repeat protein [Candidatus Binatia bacterium]
MMTFVWLLLFSAGFVAAAWLGTYRLTRGRTWPHARRWLVGWSIKGLAVPMVLWMLMNIGVSWQLQPFMPEIQMAQNSGGDWLDEFLRVVGIGLFITSSYWAASTLGWVLARVQDDIEEEARKDFKALCWTCSLAMAVPALIILGLGGLPALGLGAAAILVPLAGYAPALLNPKKLPPIYARALARLKFGKYTEAEWEIIRELERCEDDFEGWMMLAELYANQFHDLAEAEHTVLGICAQPTVTASQLSVALHKLAEWHLKHGGDPVAARRALQTICDRLPGTHLARMARLRMNQLPASAVEFRQQQAPRPLPLPALGDSLDAEPAPAESKLEKEDAVAAANACVGTLKQNPNNVPARERLARLFAERLQQPDLAVEQITLLLNMPEQPEAQRAEWLGLLAAWQIKYRQDFEAARSILERIIREFPKTPQALAAQRRMQLLDAELRGGGVME